MSAPKVQILPLRRTLPAACAANASSGSRPSRGSPPEDNEKKTRTSKPKVRSGCVTCKIRRVKCDETKPACDRCTSTGRKCDGYVLVPRKKRAVQAPDVKQTPTLLPDIGMEELRAIDYFHHKTAPGLASYFDAEFWTRLVVQMSYVEPTVRHAIVALGSLHEQRESDAKWSLPLMGHSLEAEPLGMSMPLPKSRPADENRLAITQYNKAISHLSNHLQSQASIEVTLLACILFVCVEFLRGDSKIAVNHFKNGMKISITSISDHAVSNHAISQRVKEQILPFFNRIELLSTLFGNETPWQYPVPLQESIPDRFASVRDARDSIVHIANLSLRFIRYMKYRKYDRLVLPDDLSRQDALIRQLELWSQTLDNLLASDQVTRRDLDAAKTLRIHQIVCLLWMRRSTTPEECSNDLSMSEFETAVDLAESIHSVAGTRGQRCELNSSTFLFDMEIVSPIYYVCLKCRHPQLRRRAITVLAGAWRREGLWDSNMAAAIARRCVELEEKNLTILDGSQLPLERDRIYNVHINSEVGIHPKHHRITLYQKPEGVDGPWMTWNEMITLTTADGSDTSVSNLPPAVPMISSVLVPAGDMHGPGNLQPETNLVAEHSRQHGPEATT